MKVRLIRSKGAFSAAAVGSNAVLTRPLAGAEPVRSMRRFGAKRGLERLGLGILRAKPYRLRNRPQCAWNVFLVAQGQRQVELIIRIIGIGCHRLLEVGRGIQSPAAGGHTLVVDHFRQWQLLAHEGEGVFRLDIAP